MRKNNYCKLCNFYKTPHYYNIMSPCKNCEKSHTINNYGVSTATVIEYDNSITCLPSAKEYRESANKNAFQFTAQWSEPKYQCPECGGGMCRNEMVVLTTYPAQYEYQCDKCGHIEYQYM